MRKKELIHVFLLITTFCFMFTHDSKGQDNASSTTTATVDSNNVPANKPFLSSKVNYNAADSMVLLVKEQKAYLYGQAFVKYEDLQLEADFIEIDFNTNIVLAKGVADSSGVLQGTPKFTEKGQEYFAQEMRYNFDTKKGKIKQAMTQENEGFIHGQAIKKETEDIFYIKNGRYTTCNLEHPHFYINASKLKVINEDKIVTGPANFVIEDIPTPIAIPFGFFPNKQERKSGIVLPTWGEDRELGFNIRNGGYYWAISKYADTKFLFDVYTNGSYTIRSLSNYKKRYGFNGNLDFSYANTQRGDPETKDFSRTESFFVVWAHNQDNKANPYSNFRARVNAGSSNYYRNDFNVSAGQFLQNQFKSSITYTKRFPNSPFSINVSASHSQNTKDSTIFITLPQASINMTRIYPLKRRKKVGKDRFYEKIGLSWTSNIQNSVVTKENDLLEQKTIDLMKYGVNHSIPIATSFKAGYFNINPRIDIRETWNFKTVEKTYVPPTFADLPGGGKDTVGSIQIDTTNQFQRFGTYDFSVGTSTKIYGMYALKKGRIKALRHTMTPTISWRYSPDLDSDRFYKTVQTDTDGNTSRYSIFEGVTAYSASNAYEKSVFSFGLQNSLEMKYDSRNDTIESEKKIKLIDAFNFNTNYDVHKDSLNLSPIRVSLRSNIGKYFNMQLSGTYSPYEVDKETGKTLDNYLFQQEGKDPLRLTNATGAFGLRIASKPKNKSQEQRKPRNNVEEAQLEHMRLNPERYVNFNIPWSLNFRHNVTVAINYSKEERIETWGNILNASGDFNITEKWKVSGSTGYDFEKKEVSFTTLQIHRDLHCWQISMSVIPFGPRTSYSFDIGIKASILQDLKYNRRNTWFN